MSAAVARLGQGNFIVQLRRLDLQYTLADNSLGLRQYLTGDFIPFAFENQSVEFNVGPQMNMPHLTAHYLNGKIVTLPVGGKTAEEIAEQIKLMRDVDGGQLKKVVKPWITSTPSIQGYWSPFQTGPSPKWYNSSSKGSASSASSVSSALSALSASSASSKSPAAAAARPSASASSASKSSK